MATSFRCSIVTPAESLLTTDATYVTFQAWDGQRGVMAGASPFLAKLSVGTVRVELAAGGSKTFLIDSGFAKMQENELTLLTDHAEDASVIKRVEAEAEYAAAKSKVVEPGHTAPEERERLERAQKLAAAKLALSRN